MDLTPCFFIVPAICQSEKKQYIIASKPGEERGVTVEGAFTFVLYSHRAYVRKAGRWPHGQAMVHEALAKTYVPLLNGPLDLQTDGYEPCLTIGLTPILLEQPSEPAVRDDFGLYNIADLNSPFPHIDCGVFVPRKARTMTFAQRGRHNLIYARVWQRSCRANRYGRIGTDKKPGKEACTGDQSNP